MNFYGIRVIESAYLVENGEPYEARRSWRERLFSRPWRPWHSTVTVTPQIPMRGGIWIDARTMAMHPQLLRALSVQLAAPEAGDEAHT